MTSLMPLKDLRVVDATLGLAGAVATMILAHLGAEVVRDVRVRHEDKGLNGGGPLVWHRRKRALTDQEQIEEALGGAALLVLTPDIECAPFFDVQSLRKRNPKLSVLAITTGLDGGPHPVDCDILVQARWGLMDEQRGHRAGPVMHDVPLPSYGAAYLGAVAGLAALVEAARTGQGQDAAVSLADGVRLYAGWHWIEAEKPSPSFWKFTKTMPVWLFQAGDGKWLHLHPAAEGATERIHAAFGLDVKPADDVPQAQRMFAFMESWREAIRARRRDDVVNALWNADVPVQPVCAPGAAFDDPQVAARGYIESSQADDGSVVTGVGNVIRITQDMALSGAPLPWRKRAHCAGKPLSGLRMLDFTVFVAGSITTMVLADLGADVIKVERPGGDPARSNEALYFAVNRGKRSICLDLKSAAAQRAVRALAQEADVLHHNMRPGTLERMGLDDAFLSACPTLIQSELSSYGQTGPRASWPGFDQLFQAQVGFEYAGGGRGNPPLWYRTGFVDICGGMLSAAAILASLLHRARKGTGRIKIDISLLGAALTTRSECVRRQDCTLLDRPSLEADQTGYGPFYAIYKTADGWIAVSALDAPKASALVEAAGLADEGRGIDLRRDPAALKAALAAVMAKRPSAAWIKILTQAHVPCARVREGMGAALLDDKTEIEQGNVIHWRSERYGLIRQMGAYIALGGTRLRSDRPAPALGAHTAQVLAADVAKEAG